MSTPSKQKANALQKAAEDYLKDAGWKRLAFGTIFLDRVEGERLELIVPFKGKMPSTPTETGKG